MEINHAVASLIKSVHEKSVIELLESWIMAKVNHELLQMSEGDSISHHKVFSLSDAVAKINWWWSTLDENRCVQELWSHANFMPDLIHELLHLKCSPKCMYESIECLSSLKDLESLRWSIVKLVRLPFLHHR